MFRRQSEYWRNTYFLLHHAKIFDCIWYMLQCFLFTYWCCLYVNVGTQDLRCLNEYCEEIVFFLQKFCEFVKNSDFQTALIHIHTYKFAMFSEKCWTKIFWTIIICITNYFFIQTIMLFIWNLCLINHSCCKYQNI